MVVAIGGFNENLGLATFENIVFQLVQLALTVRLFSGEVAVEGEILPVET